MTHTMNMTYRSKKQITREMAGSSHTLAILMSKLRVCLEAALEQAGTRLRLVPHEITARPSRDYVSSLTRFLRPFSSKRAELERRLVMSLLLMLTLGSVSVWGQAVDLSGTYYIASHGYDFNPNNTNNYYLCPTEGWAYYVSEGNPYCTVQGDNNGQPFLTTYQIKKNSYDVTKAKWTLTKIANSDYYYIQQAGTSNYIVTNGALNKNLDRGRVHLETINNPNDLDEKAQFAIYPYNGHMVIKSSINEQQSDVPSGSSHFGTHDDHKWFTVNQGNKPNLDGTKDKTDGPSSFPNTGGIIGIFTEIDTNADFYLEDVITRPTITIDSENKKIEITAAQTSDVTIKYTTDGSTPSASNGTEYTVAFELGDYVTIKAVAIVSSEVSNVATFQRRLIQNQGNGWNDNTDFHFYMNPGDDGKVNTTSLFRPSMEWYLIDAKNGFNYIVNASNYMYLCYDGTNVSLTDYNNANDNQYKFGIRESPTAGTFNICPYLANILYKNGGNDNAAVLAAWVYSNDHLNSGYARWKFVLPSTLDKTSPFVVSDNTSAYYYKIASVGSSGYYIIPGSPNAITSNNTTDANVVKSGIWYFEVALAATNEDWCTYYHIRNAETGEYLYFTKDANGNEPCLATSNTITEGSENRYMFTWARTATENAYYIVPKILKDVSLNQISSLRKQDNKTGIISNITRGASNFAWNFSNVLFCKDPIFEEKEIGGVNKIEISCVTTGSEIHYTLDGSDPSDPANNPQTYSEAITSPTGNVQMVIRAIAVVSDANLTPSTASSEISTLLYNPTITLDPAYNYGYDGTAKTPGATVSVGEVTAPTTAYTIGYSGDNVNVGTNTATATIQDVTDDNWYIWGNLSVTFSITLPTINITVSIANWTYGGTASTPSVSGNPDGTDDQIIYEYKVKDAGNNTYSSTVPTNAGDYVVKATLPGSTNYGESVATKDFVINKATLTVTGSDSKHYGADDPASIAYTTEGLASWDTASEILTGSLIRAAGENTGTYAITQGTLALSENAKAANYTLVFAGGTFRIIGTNIAVTLSLEGWTYGDDANVPSIEVTNPTDYPISTATIKYYYKKKTDAESKYTEEVPLSAGAYHVKAVINPNVSYEGAEVVKEFSIGKAAITITADDKVKGYGDNDPKLTYTVSGLKYSDSEQVVLTCELQRTAGEDMGNYAITKKTPDNSIIKSGNYSFSSSSFTGATLTITAKSLGNSETLEPAPGIRIYAIKNGEDSWTVSVYNNETTLTENTDYTYGVTGPDNGIYTIVVNSVENSKCTGSAKATYFDLSFNAISPTEKVAPYITSETNQVTATVGVRPYIVSKVTPSVKTITVVPVSYIPKDVPVLLLADNDATGLTIIPKNDDINDIPANILKTNKLMYASQDKEVAAAEVYVYYRGEFVLALAGTITPDHYYLYNPNYVEPETPDPTPNPSPSRSLNIIRDNSTGILVLTSEKTKVSDNDIWYTLDGRRLKSKPTSKGLYIRNNQKVVVK